MEIRNIKSVKELRKTWNFCKSMGITQVMKVPRRKRGMTGSGIKHDCHWNARLLTRTYGGSSLLGYAVTLCPQDGVVVFHSHTVWKTPEGKVVCVTQNGDANEDAIIFLPIAQYDPSKEIYWTNNILFHPTEGITVYRSPENGVCSMVHKLTNKKLKRTTIRDVLLDYKNEPDVSEGGGFTEPSTATGKLFELREVA